MPRIEEEEPKPTGTAVEWPVPRWTTADGKTVRLYLGNVTDVLSTLPPKSVHCVVTSPPYWGLRDYGTAAWEGGDPTCKHKIDTTSSPERLKESEHNPVAGWTTRDQTVRLNQGHRGKANFDPTKHKSRFRGTATGGSAYLNQGSMTAGKIVDRVCPLGCGAVYSDSQLGSEPSPDCKTDGQAQCGRCHVCNIVAVFRGVYRVLRDDGTIWVNYGDSYSGGEGLKSGNLVGIPWRVALALQADGWVLRSDIPWVKRSCMPESTSSRPTKALEYVFLLTKHGSGYFYDADAVRKAGSGVPWDSAATFGKPRRKAEGLSVHELQLQRTQFAHLTAHDNGVQTGRNFRNADLWFESVDGPHGLTGVGDGLVGLDVTSQGYEGAHFATFPPKLIEPMIKAGTSEKGCCAECGAPWRRVLEEKGRVPYEDNETKRDRSVGPNGAGASTLHSNATIPETRTVGWEPTCECHGTFVKRITKVKGTTPTVVPRGWAVGEGSHNVMDAATETGRLSADERTRRQQEIADRDREVSTTEYVSDIPLDDHPIVPCVVLDPFMGSGTTAAVCLDLGRDSVGIDLNEKYILNNQIPRIEGAIVSRPALARLLPRRAVTKFAVKPVKKVSK